MKAKILKLFVITAAASLLYIACDSPLSLGSKLDVVGPVVEFTSPVPRKAVTGQFTIEGTASDFSGVKKLLVSTEINNTPYPKQWRYNNGSWEISENYGTSWMPYSYAEWNGSEKSASWKISVDMIIPGETLSDGEYMFSVRAWDKSEFSDDNSFKTRVLIIDRNPPWVEIINPFIYKGNNWSSIFELTPFMESAIPDNSPERFNPALIGKFITRGFRLQWQINDNHDIWSIDLRFYKYDAVIDNVPETPLPDDDYIYSYRKNLPPPPVAPDPANYIRTNGSVLVPALDNPAGYYDGSDGYLYNPINEKTTIKVVSVCYDAAGNVSQEKTLGYFVYWPLANAPWVEYSDKMRDKDPEDYYGKRISDIEEQIFMIYPGRTIKAYAYQTYGIDRVEYALYKLRETGSGTGRTLVALDESDKIQEATIKNPPRFGGILSESLSWEFTPPNRSGYYVVKAFAYGEEGNKSVLHSSIFRVQDISFPNFPNTPRPVATDPLFMAIDTSGNFTIYGEVWDATEIKSLYMVWINPQSRNYAANSQLSYFRDPSYAGWGYAANSNPGGAAQLEDLYDVGAPNKVWNLALTRPNPQQDPDTGREKYLYSKILNLYNDLGIGVGANDQPLKSQQFLFRAENPDGRCTIITYAPDGDSVDPKISIDTVRIERTGTGGNITLDPNEREIRKFEVNDRIVISGRWEENSAQKLAIATYFSPSMKFSINSIELDGTLNTARSVSGATGSTTGTFTASATVGANSSIYKILDTTVRDALMINISVADIGGNPAEASVTWGVKSEALRFVGISSTNESDVYTQGQEIEISLEFSKPVLLKNPTGTLPVLRLNTTGGTALATYKSGQDRENTKHFFTYTVSSGHNTSAGSYLNVSGISIDGGNTALPSTSTAWQGAAYPFTWVHTNITESGTEIEEIRITSNSAHAGGVVNGYNAKYLPLTGRDSLGEQKQIVIDTTPPDISNITSNPEGWQRAGAVLQVTVLFDKNVTYTGTPTLTLGNSTTNIGTTTGVRRGSNSKELVFTYTVAAGNNTGTDQTNQLQVRTITGAITDTATQGIPFNNTSFNADNTASTLAKKQLGVYLDTTSPPAPQIVLTATAAGVNRTLYTTSVGVSAWDPSNNSYNTVTKENLNTLYDDSISVQFSSMQTGTYQRNRLEYSVNAGKDWITIPTTNTLTLNFTDVYLGQNDITARQVDIAGNESDWTRPATFKWDKGDIVSRVSTTSSPGVYTYVASPLRADVIPIKVNFRIPVRITGLTSLDRLRINLDRVISGTTDYAVNVTSGVNTAGATVTGTGINNATVTELTFNYTVAANHNTSRLTAKSISIDSGIDMFDSNNFSIRGLIANSTKYATNFDKEIEVITGPLTNTTPTAFTTQTQNSDGTRSVTLDVTFMAGRKIQAGSGTFKIEQSSTNYRIPAVLTEAQRNRFRSMVGIALFDQYYIKGTNGLTAAGDIDTSTKYILDYDVNTASLTGGAVALAESFRTAESVSLIANAQAVSFPSDNVLRITLDGNNALQVPGASYVITIPAGFVQDSLGNPSSAINLTFNTGGVAKPFIRVKKPQDTVGTQTASNVQPRLYVTNLSSILSTTARMDCRTPGTTIYYHLQEAATTVNNPAGNYGNWAVGTNPPDDTNAPAKPGLPSDPQTVTANRQTYNSEVQIGATVGGNAVSISNVQGLQWRTRAKATVNNNWSDASEEMAYRSVLTYEVRAMRNDSPGRNFFGSATNANIDQNNGLQVWLRGGNAIGSSTIPGYPLTWEDDWNSLTGKRAGIRLMSLVSVGSDLNTSTWRWITWEINVPAFFDFFLGRDTETTSGAVATQYGPKQYAAQRAGWTSFKDQYRMNPGKHRWLIVNNDTNYDGKGIVNFNNTFDARPTF